MSDVLADLTIALDNALYKGGFLVQNDGEAQQIAKVALSAIEASGYAVMQKETMLAMIALTTEMAETLTYILDDVEPTEFALSSVAREKALAALAKARGKA